MDLFGWFQSQPIILQPAILSALTAISLFVLGFLTIAGTAWANRRNTLKAARDEQKLEIYKAMLAKIEAASSAQLSADGYLRSATMGIRIHSDMVQQGLPWSPPRERFSEFSRLHQELSELVSDIHRSLEQWAIIDHRLEAFRKAFGFQQNAMMRAWMALNPVFMRLLPTDMPEGGVFPYSTPQGRHIAELDALAEGYHRESSLLSCYIGDLNVELQPLLLGHLFGRRIVRRNAPDPAQFTIRLDRYKQIIRHFEGTEFFRNGARMERELRDRYRAQGKVRLHRWDLRRWLQR